MFDLNGKSACLKNQGKVRNDQGHANCTSVGGYVPLPENKQHNTDLAAAFKQLNAGGVLLDLKPQGKHYWVDSDDNVGRFFNWGRWENLSGGTVKYAVMRVNDVRQEWFDTSAAFRSNLVCEREPTLDCHEW